MDNTDRWAKPSLASAIVHCSIAFIAQGSIAFATGNWWTGAAFAIGLYLGREHSQAEYRWMANLNVHRASLKWWSGLDPIAWTRKGVLDWFCPAVVVVLAAIYFGAAN